MDKQLNQDTSLSLPDILNKADKIAKTASRHGHSLSGGGFYATKFSEIQTEAVLCFKKLSSLLNKFEDQTIKSALSNIGSKLDDFFNPKAKSKIRNENKKHILFLFKTVIEPATTHVSTFVPTDDLFPLEIIRDTRGYIERIAEQACGSYDQGWYDAAAVMCRRLLETLIIETYEAHKLEHKIKNAADGSYFYLGNLIISILGETAWTIGRNARKALPQLKDVGDQSAHSRRYLARKAGIDKLRREFRIVIEELLHLSNLKK